MVRTQDPFAGIGLSIYVGVLLGIIFLMTIKPPLATSIIAMSVATLLGLASGVLLWWVARTHTRSRDVATPVGRV
jgi:hypothetical protein